MKFPKLGTCADKLYDLRDKKRAANKVVKKIEEEEKTLRAHIINTLPKSNASGVSGKSGHVKVIVKEMPQYEDKQKFHKFVRDTGRFDLMQGKLAEVAIQEMWEDGVKIPGVGKFNVVSVSLTKV